jgi:hypothetical protein
MTDPSMADPETTDVAGAAANPPVTRQAADTHAGDVIIAANLIGTFAFTVTAVTAAVVFSTASQWVGAITAMALFAIGVFAFLWSFWNVVQRSREQQIAVTQVYLLLGAPTPPRVRRNMLGLLAVQIVVACATALGRSKDIDGSPGTSLAVGVLVPMFGIGLNGLWSAYHGTFPPLHDQNTNDVATSAAPIDKNEEHG